MTEPGKRRDHGAHRGEPKGLRTRPLLWSLLAVSVVVVLTIMGFLLPWGGQDKGRDEPSHADAAAVPWGPAAPVGAAGPMPRVLDPPWTEAAHRV